jgi:hypothetical protein
MDGFMAVMRGSFAVRQAGAYTFDIANDDGFIFGMGNGNIVWDAGIHWGGFGAANDTPVVGKWQ